MRRLSAILLIALFLFNLCGYRIWVDYAQQQSDKRLEASFDKQEYDNADLITIKVPLSLPYLNNQQDFERIDGEINVGGKILKYVKRKISDGNLILLCIPDHNKMRIESAKDEFFKYANDLVQNNHSKKSTSSKTNIFKALSMEYEKHPSDYSTVYYQMLRTYSISTQLNFLPPAHRNLPEHPPDFILISA